MRAHFERLRFHVNQQLQRDSLLLVADECVVGTRSCALVLLCFFLCVVQIG